MAKDQEFPEILSKQESVNIQNRYVPHFKPGKNFRESVKDAGNKIVT